MDKYEKVLETVCPLCGRHPRVETREYLEHEAEKYDGRILFVTMSCPDCLMFLYNDNHKATYDERREDLVNKFDAMDFEAKLADCGEEIAAVLIRSVSKSLVKEGSLRITSD